MTRSIAIIGCGLWGRNLVRNFYNLGALHSVCDLDKNNLEFINNEYPSVNTTGDFNEILKSEEINGVVVATPSHTHYSVVKILLNSGKNVYVEKPIATSADEAKELKELADQKGLVLMVGHLLLYHPAVNRLKSLVSDGTLGDICYVQSDRLNVNYFKNDRSVMWDLAPHDLSMINYILDKTPTELKSAVGFSSDNNGIMDIVHLDLGYEGNIHAHISDSWIHPAKRVVLLIRGTKFTAILDDAVADNKIQIFDNSTPGAKVIECPDYLEIEPLKLECQHFLNCIANGIKARSDGDNGYEIVRILEQADKIMLGENLSMVDNFHFVSSRTKK